ncbi:MAG: hypothetical protein HZA69_07925 [Gammaproteobacteria bacterium]|nr:hypothetical protein [Gammaproteobacteria bacterium]
MRAHVTPVLRDCKPVELLHVRQGYPVGVYRQISRLCRAPVREKAAVRPADVVPARFLPAVPPMPVDA